MKTVFGFIAGYALAGLVGFQVVTGLVPILLVATGFAIACAVYEKVGV